jgi:methanogenic corrinoid protein MtbC1
LSKLFAASPKPCHAWVEASAFEAALLSGDHRSASTIIGGLIDDDESVVDIGRYVVQPALYDIGAKWAVGLVTVAQEARATAIAEAVMADARVLLPLPTGVANRALLGCVQGNHHVVGLTMVCDAFQSAGWLVKSLGANAPTALIVDAAAEWRPDIVGLSATLVQQLPRVKEVIVSLRERFPRNPPSVIVGGHAFTQIDLPANVVGANAYAPDAQGAVTCAKVLVYAKQLAMG